MYIKDETKCTRDFTWILRSAREKDALELSELRTQLDGETEFLDREPGEGYLSEEDFKQIIEKDSGAKRHIFLVAEHDNRLIGFARCEGNSLRRFSHKAEFGICISKRYWGKGIGKALLERLLLWADTEAKIEKVCLTVVEDNEKAIEMYKRFGFKKEGVLIKDRKHKDGNYHNTVIMGRFNKIL